MKYRWISLIFFLSLSLLPLGSLQARSEPAVRRFALIVGSNQGGPGRVALRYAGRDAQEVARVLAELGGVHPVDQTLLQDPGRSSLLTSFRTLHARLNSARSAQQRLEVLFYYSGHSDEDGLLLGTERMAYPELRRVIAALPADVRIAILDSCSAGAFTRTKGGVKRPPFLVDTSVKVAGHAFLASSSLNEAAQESDRMGGSFFTHYLLTGLRGAADLSGDDRVTLMEAYHFAFQETLAGTSKTLGGAQHPAYDIQLAGTGDVVMTDLHSTSASLALPAELSGRVSIRDARGALAAELRKFPGRPVELGLEPGEWTVSVAVQGKILETKVILTQGRKTVLEVASLKPQRLEATVRRGPTSDPETGQDTPAGESPSSQPVQGDAVRGSPSAPETQASALALGEALGTGESLEGELLMGPVDLPVPRPPVMVPFNIGLAEQLAINGLFRNAPVNIFSVNAISGHAARLTGLEVSGLWTRTDEDARGLQVAGLANDVGGWVVGMQVAGLANRSQETLAFQTAGLLNLTDGQARGFQVAGGANLVRGDALGFQVAGGLNLTGGQARGFQVAGGANLASEGAYGIQVSGGANLAPRGFLGLQLSGGVNVAGSGALELLLPDESALPAPQEGILEAPDGTRTPVAVAAVPLEARAQPSVGFQLAPVNVAQDLEGVQLGVVNVARQVSGVQMGVVNVASGGDDLVLGLVNVVKDGVNVLEVSATPAVPLLVGLKGGGRYNYTGLLVGGDPRGAGMLAWGALLGFRLPSPRVFADLDLSCMQLNFHPPYTVPELNLLNRASLLVGLKLGPKVSLLAGPSVNLFISSESDGSGLGGAPASLEWNWENENVHLRLWPSLQVGIQLF